MATACEIMLSRRREYLRRYKANWYQRNKARILAAKRGNPKAQAWTRAYYARTKERRRELAKNHKRTIRPKEYFRAWRDKNKDRYLANNRLRYAKNPTKHCAESARRHQKQRAELRECYVRKLLSFRTKIKPSEWPASLVELMRAQLKLKRLWQRQKTSKN